MTRDEIEHAKGHGNVKWLRGDHGILNGEALQMAIGTTHQEGKERGERRRYVEKMKFSRMERAWEEASSSGVMAMSVGSCQANAVICCGTLIDFIKPPVRRSKIWKGLCAIRGMNGEGRGRGGALIFQEDNDIVLERTGANPSNKGNFVPILPLTNVLNTT